jgi:hypothetical protein
MRVSLGSAISITLLSSSLARLKSTATDPHRKAPFDFLRICNIGNAFPAVEVVNTVIPLKHPINPVQWRAKAAFSL